jgi:hypothetical protein
MDESPKGQGLMDSRYEHAGMTNKFNGYGLIVMPAHTAQASTVDRHARGDLAGIHG